MNLETREVQAPAGNKALSPSPQLMFGVVLRFCLDFILANTKNERSLEITLIWEKSGRRVVGQQERF